VNTHTVAHVHTHTHTHVHTHCSTYAHTHTHTYTHNPTHTYTHSSSKTILSGYPLIVKEILKWRGRSYASITRCGLLRTHQHQVKASQNAPAPGKGFSKHSSARCRVTKECTSATGVGIQRNAPAPGTAFSEHTSTKYGHIRMHQRQVKASQIAPAPGTAFSEHTSTK